MKPPICAVCGRQVDQFELTPHHDRNEYVARCHGREQRVTLTHHQLSAAGPRGIEIGVAFDEARALSGPIHA